MITYKRNTAGHEDIQKHFDKCDAEFINDLASRVLIPEYIDRMLTNAIRYEAWSDKNLIGFLAIYANQEFNFITNLSIAKNFSGQGIGSRLLQEIMASQKEVRLEVMKNNIAAQEFYKKFGFETYSQKEKTVFLRLKK